MSVAVGVGIVPFGGTVVEGGVVVVGGTVVEGGVVVVGRTVVEGVVVGGAVVDEGADVVVDVDVVVGGAVVVDDAVLDGEVVLGLDKTGSVVEVGVSFPDGARPSSAADCDGATDGAASWKFSGEESSTATAAKAAVDANTMNTITAIPVFMTAPGSLV